ncbi:hypothetical protein KBI52_31770 [Microvirga sp. HBU67558]|uniref:hypothetical protein n=1 Tax=Microvirga TaxID=186650 RepID=UPI001B37178F|nr:MULTISPECIES: hypothetical protein [unclassified Microvirga]MBQ0824787.1 hypothetical protein [Microvirga sp. HBU67558]
MAGTLASLLADFSSPAAGDVSGISLLRTAKVAPEPALEPQQPAVDRQAELVRSVEARIRAEEKETARRMLEDAIAAERARHAEHMDAQRALWTEQQAQQLSARISEAIDHIDLSVSERVANVLRPFVSEAYRQQTLAEFKDVLAALLAGRGERLLTISGPDDLLSAMKPHLESYGSSIEFVPSDQIEVSATAQDTFVQTQLSSWASRLAQTLES